MRVLVDTHTLLWDLLDTARSSRKARRIFSSDTGEVVFSLVSLWQIASKIKIGKLNTMGSSVAQIRDEMNAYGMGFLPIRCEHILRLESLPRHHNNPSTAFSWPRPSPNPSQA